MQTNILLADLLFYMYFDCWGKRILLSCYIFVRRTAVKQPLIVVNAAEADIIIFLFNNLPCIYVSCAVVLLKVLLSYAVNLRTFFAGHAIRECLF